MNWRVNHVLYAVNHHRARRSQDIEDTFDAEYIFAVAVQQHG